MAKTALDQLQDQIEAIRREAYDAGYAAAMQAIRDFAARPTAGAPATRGRRAVGKELVAAKPTAGRRRRGAAAAKTAPTTRRPQRGSNARLIAEVLKALPSGTGRPADIRKALQTDKGVEMAFTSIRHALDGKIWRYTGA